MTVQYDGTDFVGWQRQASGPSVQAELEEVLFRMTGARPFVRGAGRTDAGVHACAQVAHFDTEASIPLIGFLRGMNSQLPRAIAVTAIEEAPPDFDARFSAHRKLYRYQIWNAEARAPLLDRYAWHFPRPLKVEPMRVAAALLVGRHDFSAFRAADCERKTTVRTVSRLTVERTGDLVIIEVEADAFLKNMVRILTGTLVAVGHERLAPEEMTTLLASRDRTRAGMTAPPRGLELVRVEY
jgi:tRNA pseudouridine38-40 synthase